ncbi:MAG: hypothetical protein QOE45_2012 [Frankiaceae bacterium]|jgi:hypothetical protein|nr:hypothetical protein [Frankiaceae bacterium]
MHATPVLAAACGLVLAAGGAVAVSRATDAPHAAARPTPTPAASRTPAAAPPTITDFLLPLDEAIPRYDRESDTTSQTGPIDLARAAQLGNGNAKPTAAEKQAIQRLGFLRGHSRAYADPSQLVVVYVYEWRTAAQAKTYVASAPHLQRETGRWRPGPPNAGGSCRIRQGLAIDTVTMAVGRHTFTVTDIRDGDCATHAEAARIATLQYGRAVRLHA